MSEPNVEASSVETDEVNAATVVETVRQPEPEVVPEPEPTEVVPEPEPETEPEPEPTEVVPEPEPEAEVVPHSEPEVVPEPEAAPTPSPRPRPRPGPRPGAGNAGQTTTDSTRPASPPPLTAVDVAAASAFGRVDDDGTVYVRDGDTERSVGQYPGASAEEALKIYIRRYLDLKAQLALFEARIESLSTKEIDQNLATLSQALVEPQAVGDLTDLRNSLDRIREQAGQIRANAEAARQAARQAALEERTALIEQVEQLAEADPDKIQWRQTWDKLRDLMEQWKTAQRTGPRIDHTAEDELWKRFGKARTSLERKRRHHFNELEKEQATAKAAKEAIVAEAEKLTNSREWGATSAAFRNLMSRWREAGRAARKDDDTLWERFNAARSTFNEARDATFAANDAEQNANLEAKQAIIAEAEALLPIKDLKAAKAAIRRLQDRWDGIGHVPRAQIGSVDARFKAVEDAVRNAEDEIWRKSNPQTKARAVGAASQLEATIAQLETELSAAEAKGDAKGAKALREALAARQTWLEQIQRAAAE